MAKWGKGLESGREGDEGVKGEGIDESAQGELYEENEIKSEGEEIKRLLDLIDEDDEKEEETELEASLKKETKSPREELEDYIKSVEEAYEIIEENNKKIEKLRSDLEERFG